MLKSRPRARKTGLTAAIRFAGEDLKVRRFGDPLNRCELVRPGEEDRLTGWAYDELRRLGEGVFEYSVPEREAHAKG